MLMYKMRKLRSHFLSHLYAVMHDARPSLFYLRSCVRSCGTRAELVVCGRAVMRDARPSLFIFAILCAVLWSCGQVLGTPLSSGNFHHTLKESVISPLLKKPTLDKDELSNYCPMSNELWNFRS